MLRKMMAVAGVSFAMLANTTASAQANLDSLPDAQPGECFAKVLEPAQYKNVEQTVVTREASHRIEVVPAQYKTVEETVVVRPAFQRVVPVAAKMKTITETVTVEPSRLVWRTGTSSKARIAKDEFVASARAIGLPESAKPGACYAKFFQPAQFEDKKTELVVREAAHKIETAAAKHEWVEEKVLISDASTKKVEVPAVYETVTDKILVRPAYTTWKKGRGPIERVDNATGEIMCRVEVPAEYKEVKRRVVKTAASTKTVEIPAQYKTVRKQKLISAPSQVKKDIAAEKTTYTTRIKISDATVGWRPVGTQGPGSLTGEKLCQAELAARTKKITRRVVDVPATVNTMDVPAETKIVKVRKLISAAAEKRIEIPKETQVVAQRQQVSDEKLTWRSVLCETNATPGIVTGIQRALKTAGYDPGPIDGVIGRQTFAAIDSYQMKKGLARGGLTKDTLDALGVQLKTN